MKFRLKVWTNEFGFKASRTIDVFADSPAEAEKYVRENGVGFDGQNTVFPTLVESIEEATCSH